MANLDLSQSVGGLTAASRFLRMLIAPNILKAAGVDRSDQNLALRDLRWVEEDRGSEIDRGEVDVIVGEIIESDVGEMGRGRARPSERASGLETDGMTQTDGRTDEGLRWRRRGATHCDDPSLSIFIQADSGHFEW